MTELEEKQIADCLKRSIEPVNPGLERDLWPRMSRRLEERSASRQWLAAMFSARALSSVPWFDWALLAVLVVGICAFPKAILIWLYHF